MNAKEYIDALFDGYEDTQDLKDFKEEIASHLSDRARDLAAKGMSQSDAFDKATGELGDITEIADEISRKKRNEVIQNMYVQTHVKIGTKHAIGYTVAGALFLFGALLVFITGMSMDSVANTRAGLPFLTVSAGMFVFFGLTQETRAKYPMSWKRALWYALSAVLLVFGILLAFSRYSIGSYLANPYMQVTSALGALVPFAVSGGCILLFLLLTEKKRHKPWVMEAMRAATESDPFFINPKSAERFGILTAALWTLGLAAFLALGFAVGFQYSWLAFIFCVPVQLVLLVVSRGGEKS